MPTNKQHGKISVGDFVKFLWGVTPVQAVVLEDRGPLGRGGVHLYRIRLSFDSYSEDMEFEMPEDLLEVVDSEAIHEKPSP